MANIVVHAYDGARRPFTSAAQWSATTLDGRSPSLGQERLDFPDLSGPVANSEVPSFNNFADLYTVLVNADGHDDSAGFRCT